MTKPRRISISGDLGSGKSTVCRILCDRYGFKYFSTGSIQRKIASEMGMTTLELNQYMETHKEMDGIIDGELVRLSDSVEDIVIDSRMAWHFTKDTFKVFLTADERVAAERIVNDKRGSSEGYADIEEAVELLRARKISENLRYSAFYGVNCADFSNYDLVLDTSALLPEAVADTIIKGFNEHNIL